ncbi:rubredoxin-like domain-containing protein [Saliphagus sp. LR7]
MPDSDDRTVWRCSNCEYTHVTDEEPDVCLICREPM